MSLQVYVGGVRDVSQSDIRKKFEKFGKVHAIDMKKNFAFIVSNFVMFITLFRPLVAQELAKMPSTISMADEVFSHPEKK